MTIVRGRENAVSPRGLRRVDRPVRHRKEPWHAVSVVPRGEVCDHVLALKDTRFLSAEAPPLPLPDCPYASTCRCVYKHFADRRAGPRRNEELTGNRSGRPNVERRIGRGRRKTDAG